MVATVEKRLTRLEQSFGGGDECPRCKDTVIVIGVGEPGEISATQNGNRFSPEAAKAFYREEQPHGQCPQCGNFRERRIIRWGPRQ